MGSEEQRGPSSGLESDPRFHKNNSAMGSVTSGGKPVPGAKVTIVQTSESFDVGDDGRYIVVLDPVRLGARGHELEFSAPGYVSQKHFVVVPENNQAYLDVELEAAP
ncbi:MAG: carboxypeptidase-like regulatory domain-containing protein [Planctomycetota bacterium]